MSRLPSLGSQRSLKAFTLLLVLSLFFSGCKKESGPVEDTQPEVEEPENSTDDFTIVVIPDSQHYMAGFFGGMVSMFDAQISWIINNQKKENIVYVAGLGDMVEHGDHPVHSTVEWPAVATKGYHRLDAAKIPYGVAVGNHDQWQGDWGTSILKVTTENFNKYFGRDRFAQRAYYGGNFDGPESNRNNSHYDLFSAGGQDFMVIYLEFDAQNEMSTPLNDWAYELCTKYPSRKVIIVTHYAIQVGDPEDWTKPAPWGTQGFRIWNRLKDRPNVFMMLGGHVYGPGPEYIGEGYREDTHNGNTIRSYLSNYQMRGGGGSGLLRLMKFSVKNDEVTIKTYSPFNGVFERDISSEFTKPLFGPAPTASLANGKYKISPKSGGSDKVIAVKDASTAHRATIVLSDYSSSLPKNDEWKLTAIGNSGYYRITNENSSLDLNVQQASVAVGGSVVQFPYPDVKANKNDEWALMPLKDGYYKIVARHSGLSLSVSGEGNSNSDFLRQATYEAKDSQMFKLTLIP